ncbi:uncharacterized protein UV8b_01539 [Ustilaginoidea virens]|uniref:Uncharacterized protein n=1 Tax=Ustilaginoidea virens TaxID=1159556 RepID=A0A8E5MEH5_USTVR|nr:uncharacterized protein UV8b_01539 [Ustilaginoidea virens]QUC17298.1 hypothetical protein UV8b_01539 [Ustilaginoidea virens]
MLLPPRCLPRAAALARPRLLSTSTSTSPAAAQSHGPTWPLLRKRRRPARSRPHPHQQQLPSRPRPAPAQPPPLHDDLAASPDPRIVLILQALSPSLNPSDFYRLSPSDLSSWKSVIRKVQQQRNPVTLEPLGRYHISFSSAAAAASYRDRLLRLHSLARRKLRSVNGLWEGAVPAHLRSLAGSDPETELEGYAVTSGSQETVHIERKRMPPTGKWLKHLQEIVDQVGYGEKPPAVLVQVYPPTVTALEFGKHVQDHGVSRGCAWRVSPPQALKQRRQQPGPAAAGADGEPDDRGSTEHDASQSGPSESTSTMNDAPDKVKGRFVVVCANENEARRFHRHWNQRTLTAVSEHAKTTPCIVHASIINW